MPTSLTETAEYTSAQLSVPATGDARTAASVDAAFQLLTNRAAFALAAVESRLQWSGDFAVAPGGSNSSFVVSIGAFQCVVLVDDAGAAYAPYIYAGGTIGASKIEGGGNLANSSIYYVYAYLVSGVVDFEISLIPPRASRAHKTGSGYAYQSRRYIGFFPTDSSGNPLPLRASHGRYVFRLSALATGHRVLNASATVGATDFSCAALVPPHVRLVSLRLALTAAGGAAVFGIYAKPDTLGVQCRVDSPDGTMSGFCEVECDATQTLQYQLTLGGTGAGQAFVAGCQE